MILDVYYGDQKKVNKRSFKSYNEATSFINYNEMNLKISLGDRLGEKVESKPKLDDELIRKVYKNSLGELRYYILTVNGKE